MSDLRLLQSSNTGYTTDVEVPRMGKNKGRFMRIAVACSVACLLVFAWALTVPSPAPAGLMTRIVAQKPSQIISHGIPSILVPPVPRHEGSSVPFHANPTEERDGRAAATKATKSIQSQLSRDEPHVRGQASSAPKSRPHTAVDGSTIWAVIPIALIAVAAIARILKAKAHSNTTTPHLAMMVVDGKGATTTRAHPASVAGKAKNYHREISPVLLPVHPARLAPTRASGDDKDTPSGEEDISTAEAARRVDAALNIKTGSSAQRADSTDAVATFLTRRFGIAGGLGWLGVLTFGVVSEQLKTRRELREAVENTKDVVIVKEVTMASGLRYTDLRVGGGEIPRNGYLLAANLVATIEGTGEVVLDTRKTNRQVIFTFGRPQGPFTRGVMEAVGGMRQGGKRIIVVPPELGFRAEGARLQDGTVPPGATVRYELELTRVSVPPS